MRISDWSSDVCSSDLRPQDHITLEMAPLEIRHRSVRPISAKHAQASRFLQQSPLSVLSVADVSQRFKPRRALRRNSLAALELRVGERKKSNVSPRLSAARTRYAHCPRKSP